MSADRPTRNSPRPNRRNTIETFWSRVAQRAQTRELRAA